nr:immunoglobulin heavy chain junction region [Mus musculus]
CLLWSYAMDYW